MLIPVDETASGYERVAETFIAARDRTIGADVVRRWSTRLPRPARVLDVGCGHGVPITEALLGEGLDVRAVDASPPLVAAFRTRFPTVPVECADVLRCRMLDDRYDGIVCVGLLFLLAADVQLDVLSRLATALRPGGHLLFSAPRQCLTWNDALTDLPSRSLGFEAYAAALEERRLTLDATDEDEGGNFYYLATAAPAK